MKAKATLSLGPVPSDEPCAQVGRPGYSLKARTECEAYVGLLARTFPEVKDLVQFVITSNPHDFGSYLDVVAEYDENNPEAVDAVLRVEGSLPTAWDPEAAYAAHAADEQARKLGYWGGHDY